MRALVTGATGFIGNHVINELLSRGIEVVATSTSVENANQKSWFDKVTFVAHRIGETNENLMEKFHQPDLLIHLAWQGLPNYKELSHFETVLPQQYAFLKQLVTEGLKDITVTGTCFEYGMQDGELSESDIALPGNPYALAKNTLRCFLEELKKIAPFNLKWVRLFYMYGEGQSPKSILPLLEAALKRGDTTFNMSKGDQLRDYLPVEKVAGNIVSVAIQNHITGIINCCSGQPISVKTLVEGYLRDKHANIYLNFGHYPYPDYEPKDFWGNAGKINTILNA